MHIITLPTQEVSHIYKSGKILIFEEYPTSDINPGNQHLYIISDNKIKEGDWKYIIALKTIIEHDGSYYNPQLEKKIEAVTYSLLFLISNLPQISESDIPYLIDLLNKEITEVEVETKLYSNEIIINRIT